MKRISILLLLLVLCIGAVAQTIDGQLPADLEQMEETGIPVETALPASFAQSVNNGSGLADAGKTIMYTGASFALTGAAIFLVGALTFESNPEAPTMPLYPVFAIGAGAIGAAVALIGLPFYKLGVNKMGSNGVSFINIGADSRPGAAMIFEAGAGIPNYVCLDAVAGYNFGSRFFLGGGLGYKFYLTQGLINDGGITAAFPVYANARYTLGDKRTAPYAGLSVGYDVKNNNVYSGLEFGTRIRGLKEVSRGSSWWIGTKIEMIGRDLCFMSLKFGKSF